MPLAPERLLAEGSVLKTVATVLLLLAVSLTPFAAQGRVIHVEISNRSDVLDGKPFGIAGPYERLSGRVTFAVKPGAIHNRQIVDLGLAPLDSNGDVEFSADFLVLRPKDLARGNGAALFEVPNRGRILMLSLFDGGGNSSDPSADSDFGDGFLLNNGYTLAWVGCQADLAGVPQRMRLDSPVARAADGSPLTGLVRADFTPWRRVHDWPLGHLITGLMGGAGYAVASPRSLSDVLTVRDTPHGERTLIPNSTWQFARTQGAQLVPDATYIHLAGGFVRKSYLGLSITLHAVGTISTGAAIALVGQIFNIQEHWPAAVLMWAVTALAGWILLQDQAQKTLTLLLVPAWMLSEIAFYADGHIGQEVYIGRFLLVWAVFYLTFFTSSKHRIVQGILFAAAAIAAAVGTGMMLDGWQSWSAEQTFLPFGLRVWAWIALAALPLVVAAFHGHKGLIPIAAALAYVIALPWCNRTWIEYQNFGPNHYTFTRHEPNLAAHALVAAFALFVCWWGVRLASKALVNLGIVGFAVAVAWFYFSDILDKVGRSLGLIGLGILFLAGGWALEKMRRRILAGMDSVDGFTQEAK